MVIRVATAFVVLALTVLISADSSVEKASAKEELVKVGVETLLVNEEERHVLLVLKPEDGAEARRVLPLVIGIEEARSIFVAFHKITAPRPLSHDLMKKIIEEYGGSIEGCEITRMDGATFFAELRLKRAGREFTMDCRPSDAIALALRSKAPIFVRREVMNQHSVDPKKPVNTDKPIKT